MGWNDDEGDCSSLDLEMSRTSYNVYQYQATATGIRYALSIHKKKFLCAPSWSYPYVHELQMKMEKRVLNQGLVDITSTSDLDFFNYLDGNPPIIKVFANDLARQHAAKVECIAGDGSSEGQIGFCAPCDEA